MKFGVSRRNSLTVVRTCIGAVAHCTLNSFSAFDFIKSMKYASDRKFTEV